MSYTINTFWPDSMRMLQAVTNVMNGIENKAARSYWAKLLININTVFKDISNQEFTNRATVHIVIDSATLYFKELIDKQLYVHEEYQLRSPSGSSIALETHTKNYLSAIKNNAEKILFAKIPN